MIPVRNASEGLTTVTGITLVTPRSGSEPPTFMGVTG